MKVVETPLNFECNLMTLKLSINEITIFMIHLKKRGDDDDDEMFKSARLHL